ncbi:TPA: helix-turn-helix domain-containing protein [Clostridium botulinum]|uniref:helix-turn-helix domain-containing protein n=1 Tax=Clostridium botulinum TaxID=1491 RepID=UPI000D0DA022|nr:helix-turn-helix domain-containing protein [Clostridium botulinum]PSL98031.1 helix-turn-helix domain-containing protein [Clostridium botulinum]HDK7164146.1 helix-turn-helix domain-containing protein [Clostridium botulinum]HDK7166117.1 helix-turn-helix domain-containing protein [Clostridium botulinum]HDK7171619.1 helix-turn-helix domain-containing protein [Clostridium botulinum]HDK7182792.1 helix-turn-helix domain-containing protein [Clostridium botulinum]
MRTTYPMIPFPVIVAATDGDTEAINQIVKHYRGYIAKRSLRPMKDEYGNQHMVVDETLRGRLETRLITKILSFEIK